MDGYLVGGREKIPAMLSEAMEASWFFSASVQSVISFFLLSLLFLPLQEAPFISLIFSLSGSKRSQASPFFFNGHVSLRFGTEKLKMREMKRASCGGRKRSEIKKKATTY